MGQLILAIIIIITVSFRFNKPGPLLINYFFRIFISISSCFIYLIFLQFFFFFFFFLAALCGMWDLSLLTRDQIHTPCTENTEL